jgi:hypothetical protein
MPLYFGRIKSQFRPGYNWREGSVIVQKKKKILGLVNPGLNVFPILKEMYHDILSFKENWILSDLIIKYAGCKGKMRSLECAHFSLLSFQRYLDVKTCMENLQEGLS